LLGRLAERGTRIALPRIEGSRLDLRTWAPGDPVEASGFGAMEPVGGRPVEPADLDVVVTPAVAFDRSGGRIGYGGGFFDRLFDQIRPETFRVGIGFGLQVLAESLPAGAFDRTVDAVVTEFEVIRCRPRS
jgi:5-formyltetrahydrofolate cyclo-ligase